MPRRLFRGAGESRFCNIRSPINGRSGLRQVDVGNTVTAGANGGGGGAVLVSIDGLDPIYTDFTVAEPDLPLVRRYLGGPNVKVLTDADDDNVPPRAGDLYFIANTVQPGTGTVQARAVTPNPDRALWPSQFVHVRLILDILKNAKLVPSGAVQIGQNGPYIFVVKSDSTLDLRQVKPGQQQGDLTVITEGVKPGETVVVSGQFQLAPGTKVIAQAMDNGPEPRERRRRRRVALTNGEARSRRSQNAKRRSCRHARRSRSREKREDASRETRPVFLGLSRPFIQRPVMTMLLTASIIVFGILTYKQLAVNDLPAVDYPVIQVNVSYPGANPETMANTIATPLEKQFTQIPGLDLTTSTSSQGNTRSLSSSI